AREILDKLPAGERAVVVRVYDQAFSDGASIALVLGGVIALAGAVLAGWIWPRRKGQRTKNPRP
ncbi:MFS transporter, partial [Salinispora arenicola]|nr:MFS transporter [Salinispora arenicola]